MTTYRVSLITHAFATVQVEAETPEDAMEVVFDGELPYLCAQCSGWGQPFSLELGDWDIDEVAAKEMDR